MAYPELILFNAKVITVDPDFSIAEAVAIRDGRFLAVGTNQKLFSLSGPRTRRIDLKGKTILPGLVDTHNHMLSTGMNHLLVETSRARSIADLVEAIAGASQKTPKGKWIVAASNWRDTLLKEKRLPTRQDLDQATTEHPVYLPMGGHVAIVNSLALKLAGISQEMRDPPGGRLEREPDGAPNGILRERPALELVRRLLPKPTHEDRVRALLTIQPLYHAAGLTSIIDPGVSLDEVEAYQQLWAQGKLTMGTSLYLRPDPARPVEQIISSLKAIGLSSQFGDERLRMAGIKLFIDGGISIGTALLRDPYPGRPDYFGVQVIPTPKLQEIVAQANLQNWRVHAHASGDAAIDRILEAYELADRTRSIAGRRFTIEHGNLARPDHYKRTKKLGLLVSVTTVHPYQKASAIIRDLGPERAGRAIPTRELIESGVQVGGNSDSSVNPYSPLLGIGFSVTRKTATGEIFGPAQRIDVKEAIRLYTIRAAHFTFEEKLKGSIEPGKFADLIVLGDDILSVPPDTIPKIKVLMTIVGGKVVYDAAEHSALKKEDRRDQAPFR